MAVYGYMTIICNVAVSACGRGREWSRALDVLAVMARSSIQICTITYKAAVSSRPRTVAFAHSHVRSSLAYICSGAAQGLQSGDRQYFGRRPSLTSLQFTVIRRLPYTCYGCGNENGRYTHLRVESQARIEA